MKIKVTASRSVFYQIFSDKRCKEKNVYIHKNPDKPKVAMGGRPLKPCGVDDLLKLPFF